MNFKHAWDIFRWGVDYGQLLMEEERDGEDWADAFNGWLVDCKYSMPANPIPRRQPHSDHWCAAKKESFYKFVNFINETLKNPEKFNVSEENVKGDNK